MPDSKPMPAHRGARFDTNGRCLAHPDVRLCRLTNDGHYKILRKTCFKCGSAGLMSDHDKKISPHGYKKAAPHREVPGALLTAGHPSDHQYNHRGQRMPHPTARHHKREETPRRRARTLSPRRSKKSPRKPVSASHVLPRITGERLKGILGLKPPFVTSRGSDGSGRGSDKAYAAPHAIDSDVALLPAASSPEQPGETNSPRPTKMSEGVGMCRLHPGVTLAIRRTERGDGTWTISRDDCPLCAAERSLSAAAANIGSGAATPDASPKGKAKDTAKCRGSPRSTVLSDEYFSRALVLRDSDEVPTLDKTDTDRHRRSLMPHSTARMGKREGRRRGRSCPRRRRAAVDAWDGLPVC
ncbi:hypothetical protein ACHAXT_011391 [Thalassiosira profunda]